MTVPIRDKNNQYFDLDDLADLPILKYLSSSARSGAVYLLINIAKPGGVKILINFVPNRDSQYPRIIVRARKLNLTNKMTSMTEILPFDMLEMIAKVVSERDLMQSLPAFQTCKVLNQFKETIIREVVLWDDERDSPATFKKCYVELNDAGDVDFAGGLCFQGSPRGLLEKFPNASCIVISHTMLHGFDLAGFTGSLVLLNCTLYESHLKLDCNSLVMIDCATPFLKSMLGDHPTMLFENEKSWAPNVKSDAYLTCVRMYHHRERCFYGMVGNGFKIESLELTFGMLPIAVLVFLYSIEFGWDEAFGPEPPIVNHIKSLKTCAPRRAKIQDNVKEYKATNAAVKSVGSRKWKVTLRGRV